MSHKGTQGDIRCPLSVLSHYRAGKLLIAHGLVPCSVSGRGFETQSTAWCLKSGVLLGFWGGMADAL